MASQPTQRIMGKTNENIISTDIIFSFFPSFLKRSGPGTEMSGLFFYLGLFMVSDSSYIFYHLQLLTAVTYHHGFRTLAFCWIISTSQYPTILIYGRPCPRLPQPGLTLAVLYFTPVCVHLTLTGVDRSFDKISPVTKQGLWNHSADWVCRAGWEDQVLTIIEFDRLMKQCSAEAWMYAGVARVERMLSGGEGHL